MRTTNTYIDTITTKVKYITLYIPRTIYIITIYGGYGVYFIQGFPKIYKYPLLQVLSWLLLIFITYTFGLLILSEPGVINRYNLIYKLYKQVYLFLYFALCVFRKKK